MTRILALDPGFASLGYAVVELRPIAEGPAVVRGHTVELGVIRTKAAGKKRRVRAADDNVERCRELSVALGALLTAHRPIAIVAESMSFPRSSSVAAKVAMAWGVIVDRATVLGLPIVQATPQEIKRAVAGDRSASKEDVGKAVLASVVGVHALLQPIPAPVREHPIDALAAFIASLESEPIRMAIRMATARTEDR